MPVHSHTGITKDKWEILIELYSLLDENNVIFALLCHHCIHNVYCIRLLLSRSIYARYIKIEENGASIVIKW